MKMNKLLVTNITDQLRLIQMDYDIKGYIDTNEADELIKLCQSLIEVVEVYQEDVGEMEDLTRKYHECVEEIDSRGELIVKQQKENEMMKKWIKQGDEPLTPIEEKEISEWIFKNL
jgi:hypothetical protein